MISLIDKNIPHVIIPKHHIGCLSCVHKVDAIDVITFLENEFRLYD
jgi:hypothetical protein